MPEPSRVESASAPLRHVATPGIETQNEEPAKPDPNPQGRLALTVGLPFFDDSLVYPDLTVDLRYSHKFGWLVPGIGGGFRQARLNPRRVPEIAEKKKILAWHVTLGLRLEFPVAPRLFPFIGVSGELAYWTSTADTEAYCEERYYPSAWRCYEAFSYTSGYAIKPTVGILLYAERTLALEAWLERISAFSSGMFTRVVTVYHPAVGVVWRH